MYGLAARLMIALLLGVLATSACADDEPARAQSETGQGERVCQAAEILVKFKPGVDPAIVVARHGGVVVQVIPGIEVYVVAVPAGEVDQKVIDFSSDPDVEYAEPNGIVRALPADDGSPTPCDGSP